MSFLQTFHGEVRWLVTLAALALASRSIWGLVASSALGKADRILTAALGGLLDLNLVLGLILLFALPGGPMGFRLEHAATMLLAVLAGHAPMLWRKSEDAKKVHRNNLIVVVAVVAIVLLGVLRLRGGWIY